MQKRAVYADGELVNTTYERAGETYFALTTTFERAETQTKAYYETELLYRGDMTLSVGEKTYTLYADMDAPSFDKISMYDVTKVFEATGRYDNVQTLKDVLNVCEK